MRNSGLMSNLSFTYFMTINFIIIHPAKENFMNLN